MTVQRADVQWVTDDSSQPGQGVPRPDAAIVSKSQAIRNAVAEMLPVAPTNSAVLLLGEIGVGKELFAQAIHDASPRRHRPMVRVNAAAIPATLIESELFGHERAAVSGALSRHIGCLEQANGSTLFLDEIGALSPDVQARLLRVLDEGTIERRGGKSIEVDIRIIATTHRNLDDALRSGQLHEGLFHRLNELPITITSLRGRRDNIPDLACTRIDDVARPHGASIESIAPESLNNLEEYSWPGNVRELRNLIERAMVVARSPTLAPWHQLAWSVSFSGSTQCYSVHAVGRCRDFPGGLTRTPGVKSPTAVDDRPSVLIDRVLGEYREMPGLCLTAQQACRLWQLDLTDCTRILELLVAQHVLKRSATGVFIADDLRCPEGSIRREAQK